MIECIKCGKCCHYIYRNKVFKCRYLSRNNLCLIYEKRIGVNVSLFARNIICKYRKEVKYDYEGCPYNTDKPLFNSHGFK